MWLCSHISEYNSDSAVKVQCSHLLQRSAGEEVTVLTLLQKSMRAVIAPAVHHPPTSAERYQNESKNSGGEQKRGLWRSVYLCRMASQTVVSGSQHERRETEGFQCSSPLPCSGKSLCSGGYLRVVQIKECKNLLYAPVHPLRPWAL